MSLEVPSLNSIEMAAPCSRFMLMGRHRVSFLSPAASGVELEQQAGREHEPVSWMHFLKLAQFRERMSAQSLQWEASALV